MDDEKVTSYSSEQQNIGCMIMTYRGLLRTHGKPSVQNREDNLVPSPTDLSRVIDDNDGKTRLTHEVTRIEVETDSPPILHSDP